eukprot:TRINITY_DN2028_c0_g1_i2.p1 TRINITY_DN2028_c0_g1~~TRINITY_DN2028_c0_g1_i2.p1  ORF type:complete len:109 (+),score=9.69 TRINITY_DN2028_c0_g1_i2:1411-1737(+)
MGHTQPMSHSTVPHRSSSLLQKGERIQKRESKYSPFLSAIQNKLSGASGNGQHSVIELIFIFYSTFTYIYMIKSTPSPPTITIQNRSTHHSILSTFLKNKSGPHNPHT